MIGVWFNTTSISDINAIVKHTEASEAWRQEQRRKN
jgi:hypothetical protein